MPVDIETSATLSDLILRTAERVGLASQTGSVAALPTDLAVLDQLKRVVNEGYDRFLRANKHWTFLDHDLVLTMDADGESPWAIDADPARYRLPSYITGAPKTPWRYTDARTPWRNIQNLHPAIIDNYRQSQPDQTGPPSHAACRDRENGAPIGQRPRSWEVIFWPTPDADYIAQATFRVHRHQMTDLAERHIAGAQHDAALIAYAAEVWYGDDAEDPAILERFRGERAERLAESLELDTANHPDSVGPVIDTSMNRGHDGRACLAPIETHNGVAIEYGTP